MTDLSWAMGFEAGLDALRHITDAAERLVADLDGAESAWQGVGVLAVEIRKLVDLRVALRDAGYLRDAGPVVRAGGTSADGYETSAAPAAGSIPAPGTTYAPWMVDGRKPTMADYMEYAHG